MLCSSRLDADMLRVDSVATRAALDVAQQEAAQAQEDKAVIQVEDQNKTRQLAEVRRQFQNLLLDATAIYYTAFPMEISDHLVASVE